MKLPIQAQPITRTFNTAKITNTGIVASAECCGCLGLLHPRFIATCMIKCCTENPGAACCGPNAPRPPRERPLN